MILAPVRRESSGPFGFPLFAMSLRMRTLRWVYLLALATAASSVLAQEENERLAAGIPLEVSIVNRDIAYRWRWEILSTADDKDVLDQNPGLASFPAQMYTTELKALGINGQTATIMYDRWKNSQEGDVTRVSGGLGFSVTEDWRVDIKTTYVDREAMYDSFYYYLLAGRSIGKFYTYSQLRLSTDYDVPVDGFVLGYQVSEYLSWRPVPTFRIGAQAGVCQKENYDDSFSLRAFMTKAFFDYRTSVRLEATDSESPLFADYREYRAFVYQKLRHDTLLRLSYRYYTDDRRRDSYAPGFKLIYFFSPKVSCHIGYIRYNRGDVIDIDCYQVGMNVLL